MLLLVLDEVWVLFVPIFVFIGIVFRLSTRQYIRLLWDKVWQRRLLCCISPHTQLWHFWIKPSSLTQVKVLVVPQFRSADCVWTYRIQIAAREWLLFLMLFVSDCSRWRILLVLGTCSWVLARTHCSVNYVDYDRLSVLVGNCCLVLVDLVHQRLWLYIN
jgi:hypothetical protein